MTAKQGKLDPALKEAWLADLESGQFVQAQRKWGDLDGPNRCCLNVLGEITVPRIAPEFAPTCKRDWAGGLIRQHIISERQYKEICRANDDGPPDNYARVCTYIRENL